MIIFLSYKNIENPDKSISYKYEPSNNLGMFINATENIETNSDLCFLKCNNSFNLTCGCLNTTAANNKDVAGSLSGPEGNKGYNAKCLSEKNEKTDYSMLYFLNPYNQVFNKHILNHLQ